MNNKIADKIESVAFFIIALNFVAGSIGFVSCILNYKEILWLGALIWIVATFSGYVFYLLLVGFASIVRNTEIIKDNLVATKDEKVNEPEIETK